MNTSACEVVLAGQWLEAVSAYTNLTRVVNNYNTTSKAALQAACGVIAILRSHADDHLGAHHSFADLTPGVSVPDLAITPPIASVLDASGVRCSGITPAACAGAWRLEYERVRLQYATLHSSVSEYSRSVVSALQRASLVYSVFVDHVDLAFYDWGGSVSYTHLTLPTILLV